LAYTTGKDTVARLEIKGCFYECSWKSE